MNASLNAPARKTQARRPDEPLDIANASEHEIVAAFFSELVRNPVPLPASMSGAMR